MANGKHLPARTALLPVMAVMAVMAASSGCVPDIDDDLSRVFTPRILAIRAIPAEIAAQKVTSVEALVAGADGEEAPALAWQMCLERKPLTELGPVNQECLERIPGGDETRVELGPSAAPEALGDAELTTVREACSLFGPTAPPPAEGETKGGRAVDPDVTGGFYQPVVAFLGDVPALGAVRLDCGLPPAPNEALREYNSRHKANSNPELSLLSLRDRGSDTELEADAEAATVTVRRGRAVTLRAAWQECPREPVCGDGLCTEGEDVAGCSDDCTTPVSCRGAESYAWYDTQGRAIVTRREAILVSWYATAGEFTERRTGVSEDDPDVARTDTEWTSPGASGGVKLWAVVRDDRGGVSWKTYRVTVE